MSVLEKQVTPTGAKAYQRESAADRSLPFKTWHRTLDRRLYATDIDLIEWGMKEGEFVPVGVLELTRTDSDDVPPSYLKAILDRFRVRDSQQKTIKTVSRHLQAPAFIVLFNVNCTRFWVYSFSGPSPDKWYSLNAAGMINFLRKLREKKGCAIQ